MSRSIAGFRKADFQIHSPRDAAWDGARPDSSVGTEDVPDLLTARRGWARQFLLACQAKGLQAVAVTDHHEAVYTPILRSELAVLQTEGSASDLWLFPGMELTAKDSAQALIIFDADLPDHLLNKVRAILRLPGDCHPESKAGIEVELLPFNIEDLQGELEADPELRGRFIILPNVTPRGHKTVLREGFHRRFSELPYVGGYLDRCYPHELKVGDRAILNGQIPAWTSERRGVISTSDARHADFRLIGHHATWIKLARPTAESIRQAMLAADSRLRYAEPIPPSVYIESVVISGAEFLSAEDVVLSPQFNALIGGRGAGKSTLLEYIRYGLGRSADDMPATEWDPTHERRRSILQALDAIAGRVDLVINMNGAAITLSRERKRPEQITLTTEGAERHVRPDELRSIIPAQTFSQGELSLLGEDKAESRLLELITDPRRDEFSNNDDRIRQYNTQMARQIARLTEAWSLEQQLRRQAAEAATLEARIESLRGDLGEDSSPAEEAVKRFTEYERAERVLTDVTAVSLDLGEQTDAGLATYAARLDELLALDDPDAPAELRTALTHARAAREKLGDLRRSLGDLNVRFRTGVKIATGDWQLKRTAVQEEYQRALNQLADRRATAEQYQILSSRLGEANAVQSELARTHEGLADAYELFQQAATAHVQAQKDRAQLTSELAASVSNLSRGLARAEMAHLPELEQVREALTNFFAGTKVREARIESLVAQIAEGADPHAQWWDLLNEMLSLLKWTYRGQSERDVRPDVPILEAAIDPGGLERCCSKLSAERLTEAVRTQLSPRVRVIQRRGDREVEFRRASQGEKAATLLTILMNQDGGPLIIDQPEEDLDNRIINDIVGATREAKDRRQLIFATHNANLVVNGDAELVVDLNAGAIAAEGAIDDSRVRDAITVTMEGGRDAFELRRRKYNF